jgi:hypothetical protein
MITFVALHGTAQKWRACKRAAAGDQVTLDGGQFPLPDRNGGARIRNRSTVTDLDIPADQQALRGGDAEGTQPNGNTSAREVIPVGVKADSLGVFSWAHV